MITIRTKRTLFTVETDTSLKTRNEPFSRVDSVVRLAGELTNGAIYLSHLSRERAMIDVHNFRFQSSDGGASTSTTGSRSSAPSCPKPMTREYEFLFFRFFSLFRSFSLFSHRAPSLSLRSFLILHLTLCTFPMDHYFLLVTLYDELVQVRCSRREAFTGSPFFVPLPAPSFPSAFLPLTLALHGRLLFLPLSQLCFPSFLPSKRNTSFDPVNEGKCEGKITPRIGNTGRKRLEKRRVCLPRANFIVPFIRLVYSVPRFK